MPTFVFFTPHGGSPARARRPACGGSNSLPSPWVRAPLHTDGSTRAGSSGGAAVPRSGGAIAAPGRVRSPSLLDGGTRASRAAALAHRQLRAKSRRLVAISHL